MASINSFSSRPRAQLYVNPGAANVNTLRKYVGNPENPAFERVARIENAIKRLVAESGNKQKVPKDFPKLCGMLGINPHNEERIKKQWQLALKLHDRKTPLKVVPLANGIDGENTGVYLLKDKKEIVGIFKAAGSRRASTETALLNLSDQLKLGDHYATGRFAVLENPPALNGDSELSKTIVRLWNGDSLIYKDNPNKIVGFVQEYIHPRKIERSPESKLLSRAELVLLLIAGSVRDVKPDSADQATDTLFDAEESFARRADPIVGGENEKQLSQILSHQPAITDMLYLDDSLLHENFSPEICSRLAQIVSKWDLNAIEANLRKQQIRFPDRIAENPTSEDLVSESESESEEEVEFNDRNAFRSNSQFQKTEKKKNDDCGFDFGDVSSDDEVDEIGPELSGPPIYRDQTGSTFTVEEGSDLINDISHFDGTDPIRDGLRFDIQTEKNALKDEQVKTVVERADRTKNFCWAVDLIANGRPIPKDLDSEKLRALDAAKLAYTEKKLSLFTLLQYVEPYLAALDASCKHKDATGDLLRFSENRSLRCGRTTPGNLGLNTENLADFYTRVSPYSSGRHSGTPFSWCFVEAPAPQPPPQLTSSLIEQDPRTG